MATLAHRYLAIRIDSWHFKNVSDIDLAFNYKVIIDLATCTQSTDNGESWEMMEVIDEPAKKIQTYKGFEQTERVIKLMTE